VADEVSHETSPQHREWLVATLFPERQEEIYRFVDLLTTAGVERGLIGPREAPRLWERHIANCGVIAPAFAPSARVADIGSGAGLPGLVLALARPDLHLVLVEPLLRRTQFLAEAISALGIDNAEVRRARAEDLAGSDQFDAVTARAVAPLERLARWALPLCRPGGELIAMKGETARAELAAAARELDRLRAGRRKIEQFGTGVVEPPTTVVRIQSR
jgi:16S rRNA (guanine527-N7)-methyltransferase